MVHVLLPREAGVQPQLACGDCLRKPLHEFPELLGVGGTDSIFITITPIIRVIITPVDIITLIILTAS